MLKAPASPVGPAQIFIVEASAGSGKTYTLARRYIQLLLGSSPNPSDITLRQILAITFTNKAAFEMKERILEFLKKTALDKFSPAEQKEILGSLTQDKISVQQKAHLAMDHLMRNYNFFQVQTIDSFINALLSGCAFKIDLSAKFKIMRNYADYLNYSLDELIDKAPRDKKVSKIFAHFLTQYLFIENKTGWFPKKDILALVNSLFTSVNMYGGEFIKLKISPDNLFARKKEIIGQLAQLNENLPEGIHKGFANSLNGFLGSHPGNFNVDDLSDYFQRENFPVNKGHEVNAKVERLWQSVRQNIRELCELEAFSLFHCYIDIYKFIMDDFQRLASQDDVLFLEELNRKARSLFDEEGLTVAELYYRLASRFKHYLIDEFQDTSILQWKNLSLMIEEAIATGGSLFYVGDKKQAIYRFRGGEVSLFEDIQNQFGVFKIHHETLLKNFRSQKEIVRFNNEVFSPDNLRRFLGQVLPSADVNDILEVFKDSQQDHREEYDAGFVQVELMEGEDKEQRRASIKEKLLTAIRELKTRFNFKDIAILTRDNQEVADITSWLLAEGISVESDRTLNVRENPLIKEIISFLRFLNSPVDNLSFSSLIIGDIFTRAAGLKVEAMHDFLFRMREKARKQKDVHYYKEFRQEYPLVWQELFEEFFKAVGFYPLYELVVSIFAKFQITEHFILYQGFLMRFLELIKSKEEEEFSDIAGFLEFFKEADESDLYVHATQADSVHVLTIHKSKGLEFPVVIAPFLGMDVQVGASRGSYIVSAQEEGLKLLRLKKAYNHFSATLENIYRQEYQRAFVDELNNVYVALTRAKEELYVYIPSKINRGENLIRTLIPETQSQRGQRKSRKQGQPQYPAFAIAPSRYQDWIAALRDEFLEESQIKNRDRLRQGEIIHYLLSFIENIAGRQIDSLIKKAFEDARQKFSDCEDLEKYSDIVKKLLSIKSLSKFFELEGAKISTEREVVDRLGQTKRIDRLIETEKEVWIVDYKSSHDEAEQHQQQVGLYMKLIKDIYPKKDIKGFLIYLDDFKVEQVHE